MKYEVCLEGVFVKDIIVDAKSEREARDIAIKQLDKLIGLTYEEYTLDSISCIPEEIK